MAKRAGLAAPGATVNIGGRIRLLAEVSDKELIKAGAEAFHKMPGSAGEPTETGKAKRAARAAKRAKALAIKLGSLAKTGVTTVLGALSTVDPLILPGPLDAIGLMVKVAGAYTEAWETIKRRNTQSGFTGGLAASLLGLSPDEVREKLERRTAARDVHTEYASSAGMAESAFNRALGDGYRYGNALPSEARNALRELSGMAAGDKNPDPYGPWGRLCCLRWITSLRKPERGQRQQYWKRRPRNSTGVLKLARLQRERALNNNQRKPKRGGGAPKGRANGNYKTGRYTCEAIESRGQLKPWANV